MEFYSVCQTQTLSTRLFINACCVQHSSTALSPMAPVLTACERHAAGNTPCQPKQLSCFGESSQQCIKFDCQAIEMLVQCARRATAWHTCCGGCAGRHCNTAYFLQACSSSPPGDKFGHSNKSQFDRLMAFMLFCCFIAGEHGIMNVWEVNTSALQQPSSLERGVLRDSLAGSTAAEESKWVHLVGDPALLEELKDFFCYAQLLTQPQDTAGAYDITGECGLRVPAMQR